MLQGATTAGAGGKQGKEMDLNWHHLFIPRRLSHHTHSPPPHTHDAGVFVPQLDGWAVVAGAALRGQR